MRKLYLVPIIHMDADMGPLGSLLNKDAAAILGQGLWNRYKEVVSGFWDAVALFFDSLDVNGFKVYQDGLVADGADGLRIVREGVCRGSKNYEIIDRLLARGAVLVKTEDVELVKQERSHIVKLACSRSLKEREAAAVRYKLAQNSLLKRRDDFIAKRIAETLREGEAGALFIGAEHDVLSKLPWDIEVSQVKDVTKVRQYHKTLTSAKGGVRSLGELAAYLVSPVELQADEEG